MKMKTHLITVAVVLFGLIVSPSYVYAATFSDNFDDGNANGWWLGYSQHTPWVNGNWRVESGTLVQDQAGDHFNALVESLQVTDQSVETEVKVNGPSGYGGVTLWFQNDSNWINVLIYPAAQEIWIIEKIDNTNNLSRYSYTQIANNTWYKLKVDANGASGELKVYINNEYLFAHNANTPYRSGRSGVNNGNAGGYFDNFMLTYPDTSPINAPIDIRPWNKHNLINYRSRGILPVAIFSTGDFNVKQIDKKSLTFGATGGEQSLAFCNRRQRDIDRDGSKDDLMCYFLIKNTGFQCGDTEGILKGNTVNETSFEGKDFIRIVPCR